MKPKEYKREIELLLTAYITGNEIENYSFGNRTMNEFVGNGIACILYYMVKNVQVKFLFKTEIIFTKYRYSTGYINNSL